MLTQTDRRVERRHGGDDSRLAGAALQRVVAHIHLLKSEIGRVLAFLYISACQSYGIAFE
jgi:hypothetical protein